VHPYAKTKEANYLPPHERNYATSAPKPPKEKDFAYRTHAPVQDSKIADEVYTCSMKTSFVTLSHQELLSLSPEVRQKVREAVTPKCVIPDTKETHINTIDDSLPFANDDTPSAAIVDIKPPPGSLVIQDPYEQYLSSLRPGEHPDHNRLTVAKESHALRSVLMLVDNQESVESIIDPGSQIIAMSEAVCHDLGIIYDPSIRLNMQSANGEIDLSLGLAQNVPCRLSDITLYLQIHVIRSPAYDILLGRPFDILTESVVKNFANEEQTITIRDPNSGRRATIPTISRGLPRHQVPPNRRFHTDERNPDFRKSRI